MMWKALFLLGLLVGSVGYHETCAQWVTVSHETDYSEIGRAVFVDRKGYLYTTGSFEYGTVTFGDGNDSIALTNLGGSDIFVIKHAPDGQPLWAAKAGGRSASLAEHGQSVAVDDSGNVYVLGQYVTRAVFGEGANSVAVQGTDPSGWNTFLARYDADGALQWAVPSGSHIPNTLDRHLAVDAAGNAYVSTYCQGMTPFGRAGADTTLACGSEGNMVLAKYAPTGGVTWILYAPPEAGQSQRTIYGGALHLDDEGSLILAGSFRGSATFPGVGSDTTLSTDVQDGFLAKYSPDGAPVWIRAVGIGPEFFSGHSNALDIAENGDLIALAHYVQPLAGQREAFITRFDSAGELLEAVPVPDAFSPNRLAVDRSGGIHLINYLDARTLAFYDPPTGEFTWQPLVASPSLVLEAYDVAVGPTGVVYVTGIFYGQGRLDMGSRSTTLVSYLNSGDFFLAAFDGARYVASEPVPELPEPGRLSAAFPNPFAETTRFSVSVQRSQAVRVAVYNMLGQRVALLFDGLVRPGAPVELMIDAAALPNGTYFYHAAGESFTAVGKATLFR